jgi:hypothetical protein
LAGPSLGAILFSAVGNDIAGDTFCIVLDANGTAASGLNAAASPAF